MKIFKSVGVFLLILLINLVVGGGIVTLGLMWLSSDWAPGLDFRSGYVVALDLLIILSGIKIFFWNGPLSRFCESRAAQRRRDLSDVLLGRTDG